MTNDVLGLVPLFSKLPFNERAGLAELMRARPFPADRPIFWLGESGQDFYVIQDGKIQISCSDETGKEVILAVLGPGHFFGEVSLLDGGPRTATARPLTDATLLSLGREDFLRFLEEHPKAAVHMLTVLGQRQRDTLDKMRGIRNVNDAVAESRTHWQITAEYIASVTATQWFVLANICLCIAWVAINLTIKRMKGEPFDDPPSFGVLGLIITIEALFISLFVLISQAQQGNRDRIRSDMDYQVNLKAHHEVMQLHQKVDRLQLHMMPRPTPTSADDAGDTAEKQTNGNVGG